MSREIRTAGVKSALAGTSVLAIAAALLAAPATNAQQAPAAKPGDDTVVVVTGYRASLQTSLAAKKKSGVMLDAITSDDIASFPEANLAESLQRIPGISIDRDNGEGRTISVRGLGGDFTRVRINGMEALSTSGANDSGTSPNRSRAFDFNAFASELFSSAQVRKSQDAQTDEGSLGATVDMTTGHPFDYKGQKFAIAVEDAYYENGKHQNPRVSGLYSTRWAGGKMGFLISGVFQTRDTTLSNYNNNGVGQSDYAYRSSSFNGNEYPQRAGFAAPTGTTFGQTINTTTGVVTNTPVITNAAVLAAQTGSDPTAYAALYPAGFATPGRYDDALTRISSLMTLNTQELHTERLGLTSSFQIQWDNNTRISVDGLYSRFRNESQLFQLQSLGLNRNNTNVTLNTINTATATAAVKRNLYPGICTASVETAIAFGQDCGATLYGTTPALAKGSDGLAPVFGTNIFSLNPFNLDPFDYYNNPLSVGYTPGDTSGIAGRIQQIGRPSTKVLEAHVTDGVADYLKLSNVDWRSADDAQFYTTEFGQISLGLDHRFSDTFQMNLKFGTSKSTNVAQGVLVEFNAMDVAGPLVYDARGRLDTMPLLNPGFDIANPNNWGIVKGISGMRHYLRHTQSSFDTLRVDFDWAKSDRHEIRFGASSKQFKFYTDQYERQTDTLNPTEKEAGVSVASLGKVVSYGQGLDLPPGTPTQMFVPTAEKFSNAFGFDCNCINKYGDFRLTIKRSNAATYAVAERDTGAYVQLDYTYEIFGKEVTGNIGVRQVKTQITGDGRTSVGRPIRETNEYDDTLPAFNMNIHALDNLYVRLAASKVMARPLLSNLSPAISAVSVPNNGSDTSGGTITVGNTQLKPYRSKNYDLSVEWYFAKDSLLSFAMFDKEVASFAQTVLYDGKLSEFLDADSIAALQAQFTGTPTQIQNQINYVNTNLFTARQIRDAPGGSLWGWEASYQQPFTFLPGIWKDFGVQLNATHIDSKLTYILDPGARVAGVQTKPQILASGPWLNASPDALNFTLYYSTKKFDGRVSVSKRTGYYVNYPVATGTCSPGLQDPTTAGLANGAAGASASQLPCDSPLINDFTGSRGTTNVDMVFNYNFDEHLSARLEGLNLTNQTSNRYAYAKTSGAEVQKYESSGRQITVGLRYKY